MNVILIVLGVNFLMRLFLYFIAYIHDISYNDNPYLKKAQIRHFSSLYFFHNKTKAVLKYCYNTQTFSIFSFLFLILVSAAYFVYFLIFEGSGIYIRNIYIYFGIALALIGFLFMIIEMSIADIEAYFLERKLKQQKRLLYRK